MLTIAFTTSSGKLKCKVTRRTKTLLIKVNQLLVSKPEFLVRGKANIIYYLCEKSPNAIITQALACKQIMEEFFNNSKSMMFTFRLNQAS